MNFDRRRVFGHNFAEKFAQALYVECPSLSPKVFADIARCIGVDAGQAELFAAENRVRDPSIERGDLCAKLRLVANVIDANRKKKR